MPTVPRSFRAIALVFVSVSLAIVLSAQVSAAQQSVGVVTRIKGIARLERGGKERDLVAAMAIAVGDKLHTAPNGSVIVTFRDGSIVELGESSSLTIDRYKMRSSDRISALLTLWVGRVHSVVTVVSGAVHEFEVHTPNSIAAVRGTDFETAFIEGRPCPEDHSCLRYTKVGVAKGVVEVRNPSNSAPAVEVHAGYETTIPCESPPTSLAPLGIEELGAPGYH